MRKARLLFIIDGFGAGGAEIQLLEVLKCLPRETFESAVVSLADSGPLKKDYINLGIEIHALARKNRFDISMMIHLYRFIRTGRFDVVIPILFYPDILGTFVSKIAGVRKVISWAHASHCNALFNPRYRRILYKSVMRYADCVIAVSEDMKNSIIDNNQFLSGRMRVVPNGVDLPRFNEKAVTAVSGKKRRSGVTIGVVGRLERVKGHTYLIQALNLIKDGFPRLKCLFFGDGRERETLERQVREEHLDTVVEFRGYREDIPAVMRQLDVFVLPSISEGLPNVILEAMASSLPVVASAVGGIPEAVERGRSGMLVPPADPAALAEALTFVLADEHRLLAMGERGRRIVEQRFTRERQVQAFTEVMVTTLQ